MSGAHGDEAEMLTKWREVREQIAGASCRDRGESKEKSEGVEQKQRWWRLQRLRASKREQRSFFFPSIRTASLDLQLLPWTGFIPHKYWSQKARLCKRA